MQWKYWLHTVESPLSKVWYSKSSFFGNPQTMRYFALPVRNLQIIKNYLDLVPPLVFTINKSSSSATIVIVFGGCFYV